MSPDVNEYVVDAVAPLLFANYSFGELVPDSKQIEQVLSDWYSSSIEFLGRLVHRTETILPNILHAAMTGRTFFAPDQQALQDDLRR